MQLFQEFNLEKVLLYIFMIFCVTLSLIFMKQTQIDKKYDQPAEETLEEIIEHFTGIECDLTPNQL